MNKKAYEVISWLAVVFWMLFIFRLSSQPAFESNDLSLGITERILKFLGTLIRFDIDKLNHIVRKGAHFSAYLILAVLIYNYVSQRKITGWKSVVLVIFLCVLYAISDEVHQLFVEGRSGQLSDVLIDSIGAVTGMGVYKLLKRLFPSILHGKK